ncbi:beta-glucosidase 40-like isoform X2 [Nicotiana sylvestris]|uniref:Beta-glucosidase 40-like isoform X2 n=1 Tax=Nicotiana sylvestris TaxID=4096 RepID=A0A1U7WNJ0_NICSY|nr:PREDICTED: beta-glucosidase 40-like isoform X2 [Nicotiana sylvestris]
MLLRSKNDQFVAMMVLFLVGFHGICLAEENINRRSFPEGFVFGTASAAYQYEGAVKEDGSGPTIWDKFAHTFDVALDHYHRFQEDIQLMKDMGMDAFRLSIAWSRIFPNGSGKINQAGVDHYNKVIDSLLANGIEPYVTLYHWDLPLALEDKYKGWLSPDIIQDFAIYAETCFVAFGDRVKHWITLNEPHNFVQQGYDLGSQPPGRCSIILHAFCSEGNSGTEPYIAAHNALLAHATAVNIYRQKYKQNQQGSIGISLDSYWYESATNHKEDIEATQRALDFQLGWFIEPLVFGNYPSTMISRAGSRLPKFSQEESSLLKGSFDFIGINHYTTWYARSNITNLIGFLFNDTTSDSGATVLPLRLGKPIPDRANSVWLFIVPHGIRSLMNYIRVKYGNPTIIITENGMDDPNSLFISRKDALKDEKRIKYHKDYLTNLLASIREDGCNVKGYFVWSLLDNWEWQEGFSSRFGLYYVDYNDNLKRYPKNSVKWFNNFLSSA